MKARRRHKRTNDSSAIRTSERVLLLAIAEALEVLARRLRELCIGHKESP